MPQPDSVTLVDVARRAGVGKTTVSNVFSGTGRASAATRERVLAAAKELGYEPNRAARRLRGGRTGVVGVYVPGIPSTSEFYMRFVFGVMESAAAQSRDTVILTGNRSSAPAVDGIIVVDAHEDDATAMELLASPVPVVAFERVPPRAPARPDIEVWCDHDRALTTLLDRLADCDARRPAVLLPPETGAWAIELGAAYRRWCAARDVEPAVSTIPWIPSPVDIASATAELLDRSPDLDALFCAPVDTAPAALSTLARRGRSVGSDFLLTTGTESTAARLGHPPITALDLDALAAGRRCAELVDAALDGATGVAVEHPITLRLRASSADDGIVVVGS